MKHIKIFIELTRLNKPIGYMLLFWPCSWGLAFSASLNQNFDQLIYFLILFFCGSVLMRSAGCIINDIVDKDIDKKVERTKKRPIANNDISIKRSLLYSLILCIFAFLILIQFNLSTIFLGMGSMLLAFSYPFMKRITYWPQLFLGITFNWGILMASTAINNTVSFEVFLLYFSAIFWTLGYDTIYGLQDIVDDEIIGMKSTSIKFKKNPKLFVSICYLFNLIPLFYIFKFDLSNYLTSLLFLAYVALLLYQIKIFNLSQPLSCLKAFKLNNLNGITMFLLILTMTL